jgi:2Fe-2S ferredoxin
MQACGGKGRCTTCLFEVLEGGEYLDDPSEAELRYLAAGRLYPGFRLACQARTRGNLLIRVPASGKLPHLEYSEK